MLFFVAHKILAKEKWGASVNFNRQQTMHPYEVEDMRKTSRQRGGYDAMPG